MVTFACALCFSLLRGKWQAALFVLTHVHVYLFSVMCAGEVRHGKVVDWFLTSANSSFHVVCFIYPNNSGRIYAASCFFDFPC